MEINLELVTSFGTFHNNIPLYTESDYGVDQPDQYLWYQYIRSAKNTTKCVASELGSLYMPPNIKGKM